MKEDLQIYRTVHLDKEARQQLLQLWNAEYPAKLAYNSLLEFDAYLEELSGPTYFLLKNDFGLIHGWGFTFEREDKKWFGVILSGAVQGQGWGRKMLDALKQSEKELNGWVIDHDNERKTNGQSYTSPLKFYEKLGFEVVKEVRLELDKISAVKIRWVASAGTKKAE
jgi:ribosomal protein S18 acetylase RimI-like enzyme